MPTFTRLQAVALHALAAELEETAFELKWKFNKIALLANKLNKAVAIQSDELADIVELYDNFKKLDAKLTLHHLNVK